MYVLENRDIQGDPDMNSRQLWFLFIQTAELMKNLKEEPPLQHSG